MRPVGLPGSVEYRLALRGRPRRPMTAIGAGRTRPGTTMTRWARPRFT
jgi:hypothetical protein